MIYLIDDKGRTHLTLVRPNATLCGYDSRPMTKIVGANQNEPVSCKRCQRRRTAQEVMDWIEKYGERY